MNYEIKGDTFPVLICHLQRGEGVVTQGGGMSWMSPQIKMSTSSGGFSKAIGRMFSGESAFYNIYKAQQDGEFIAFAASMPGTIQAFEISHGNEMIFQKSAFLASEEGVETSVHFSKKFGAGLFGGEGFIMQKISGQGLVFAEFDGHVEKYELERGQKIIVDTGNLAAMSATCSLDTVEVQGLKNVIFGGEGLFNTVITGPGTVWLQTMTAADLANVISPYITKG